MTKVAVMTALKKVPASKRKAVACALIGHTRMLGTPCFGYQYCGRCEDQIGDSLGGAFSREDAVVKGHGCPTCIENAKTLTWKDKLLMPDPMEWLKAEIVEVK